MTAGPASRAGEEDEVQEEVDEEVDEEVHEEVGPAEQAEPADAPARTSAPATRSSRRRLVGVDAFRGLVLALMLLTPVTGQDGSYPLLGHAAWEGFTVSDAVLPAFLVTSGASLALLLRPPVTTATRLRLVRRLLALLILGWLYNAAGGPLDVTQVRVTGVLQLIGLSGALAAAVVLVVRLLTPSAIPIAAVAVGIPLLYGVSLARWSGRCADGLEHCSPWHRLDVAVLGADRVYGQGQLGHDPEGLAVAVAGASLVLLGVLAMQWLQTHGLGWRSLVLLGAAGALLVVAGLLLDGIEPISKRLHTPAFTFLAGGIGVLGLCLATAVWDTGGSTVTSGLWRAWLVVRRVLADPWLTLGRNALVVYLAERLLLVAATATTLATARGEQTLQEVLVTDLLPVAGVRVHLAYTALLLVVVLAIAYLMRVLRWRIVL